MKYSRIQIVNILIGVIIGVFIVYRGPVIVPDSYSFINASPLRSAGYSLIVALFSSLFGTFNLKAIIIIQVIISLLVVKLLMTFLKDKFKLTDLRVLFISVFFLFYIYRISGKITSEAFSFIFFLLTVKYLIKWVLDNDQRARLFTFINLLILVIIRAQFYFLYPVILLSVLFIYYKSRKLKLLIINTLLLIGVMIGANITDRTYHLVMHSRFIGTPFTGLQLITDALYVSKASDSTIFEDKFDRKLYTEIYSKIYNEGLTLEYLKQNKNSVGAGEINIHYNESYNPICHGNTKPVVSAYFPDPSGIDHWKTVDKITLRMAIQLIQKNKIDFFKLYVYDIIRNGFFINVILFFFMMVFFYSLIVLYNNPNDSKYFFIVLTSIMMLANLMLVALVEPILDRYSFYTNIFYYSSLFIVLSNYKIKKPNSEKG